MKKLKELVAGYALSVLACLVLGFLMYKYGERQPPIGGVSVYVGLSLIPGVNSLMALIAAITIAVCIIGKIAMFIGSLIM